jgi:hypothetical protein
MVSLTHFHFQASVWAENQACVPPRRTHAHEERGPTRSAKQKKKKKKKKNGMGGVRKKSRKKECGFAGRHVTADQ